MALDSVLLARVQFALTIAFHFLFPPITIGLAWLLVLIEYRGWRKNDALSVRFGIFFGKLLALTFAVGVATGILMEFQFGMNWSRYAEFVGDIFGAPLAAEGIIAFFLESGFLGLYLFGRNRVSRGIHWFSILMLAVGSTISAFWILAANSWQQTPAGYIVRNGRAELTDFWAAIFNPSTVLRFLHTVDAAIIAGSFFVAGIAAYYLLKKRETVGAYRVLRLALIVGFVAAVLEVFPLGHEHARQVAETQPTKFAAMEGLYETTAGAPLVLFGIPESTASRLKIPIEISSLLSWLAFGDVGAIVKGVNAFPPEEVPPVFLTFVSFHNMVILGIYFILVTAWGIFTLFRGNLPDSRWYLKILFYSIPLPTVAIQLGWITAEVGRQPWIVYGLLKTKDAVSPVVAPGEIIFSLVLFGTIYLFLGALYMFLLIKEVKHGPEPLQSWEKPA